MINLIFIELYKIFKKWRTYIGFIAIGVLVPVIHFSFYFTKHQNQNFSLDRFENNFLIAGNLVNGFNVSILILFSLFIHIPFLIVLVGGDLLAGEATAGTYRMLVTRPVSRFQIVTSKFLAGIVYIKLLIFWLALVSLGLGTLILGSGVLINSFEGQVLIFASNDVLWRFALAYIYAILSMSVVLSISFFFSSFVENAIGPIITTMAIIIIFFILSAIPLEMLEPIKPYLFTNYLSGWMNFFSDPVDLSKLWKDVSVLLAHIVVLFGASLLIFKRKDILS